MHAADHGRVDVGIGVAEQACADAHRGHVDEAPAVDVGDLHAVRLGKISGPLPRRVHLGTLAEQLGSAGDHGLRVVVEILPCVESRRSQSEQVAGIGAEDALDVGVCKSQLAARLAQGEQRFDADQRGRRVRRALPVHIVLVEPEEPVAETRASPPQIADRESRSRTSGARRRIAGRWPRRRLVRKWPRCRRKRSPGRQAMRFPRRCDPRRSLARRARGSASRGRTIRSARASAA